MMEIHVKDHGGVKPSPVNRQRAGRLLHMSCDEETAYLVFSAMARILYVISKTFAAIPYGSLASELSFDAALLGTPRCNSMHRAKSE